MRRVDRDKVALENVKFSTKVRNLANCHDDVAAAKAEQNGSICIESDEPSIKIHPGEKAGHSKLSQLSKNSRVSVFLHYGDTKPDQSGVSKRAHLATAMLSPKELTEISTQKNVVYVEAGQVLKLPNPVDDQTHKKPLDKSDRKISHLYRSHRYGQEVLIGIIDVEGIDFTHPEFLDKEGKSRILKIWDMGSQSNPDKTPPFFSKPPEGFDYGTEYDKAAIDKALRPSRKRSLLPPFMDLRQTHQIEGSHGTHVASIAAGSLSGICRKAPIAFVSLDLSSDDEIVGEGGLIRKRKSIYDSTRIAHAVEYLIGLADSHSPPLPVSINISLGTNGHAHDGSSAISTWMDHALSVPGRAISVAAGNSGKEFESHEGDRDQQLGRIHSSGQIKASGLSRTIEWNVVGDGQEDFSENEMEIWYAPQDRISITLKSPGHKPQNIGPVGSGTFIENHKLPDGSFVSIYNQLYHQANGMNCMSVYLSPNLKGQVKGVQCGTWKITLTGEDIRDGHYHAWIERDSLRSYYTQTGRLISSFPSYFTDKSNVDSHSINSLACGQRVIAVGNFDASTDGVNVTSSQGPTRDERKKPDIIAPGTKVVAARGFAKRHEEKWISKSGTSMASPYVSGIAGLMLSICPKLTASQIIGILNRTAKPLDGYDFDWQPDLGSGLINAEAALDEAHRIWSSPSHEVDIKGRARPKT